MHSLFIGLGGAGCSAVAEYAKMLQDYGIHSDDKFLYFDTEKAMKNYYPIMGNDFVHLGSLNPSSNHTINKLVRDAREKKNSPHVNNLEKKESIQFLEWFDESIRSGEPLNIGAEGVRMMSRAMLYADYGPITNKIREYRTYQDHDGKNKNRRFYVVSGSCGGTGCGMALDMLYLIQEVLEDRLQDDANDPDTNLLLIMPEGWVSGVKDPKNKLFIPYRTNPYAFFDEINGCLKDYNGYYSDADKTDVKDDSGRLISTNYGGVSDEDAGKRYHFYRCAGNHNPFSFTVCQNAYLFDSVDPDTGEPLTPAQRSANVSNFLFILETAKDTQDNLNTTISNQNRTCKFASRNKPFIEGFSASGILVAQTWEELTRKYVHDKALFQLLKYGFLGVENVYDENVVAKLKKDLNDNINEKINKFNTENKTILVSILQKMNKKDIDKIYQNIKNSVSDKKNRVAEIFTVSKDESYKRIVGDFARNTTLLLTDIKTLVFEACTQWMIDFNLYLALKLTNELDLHYDNLYGGENGKIKQISESTINDSILDFNRDKKLNFDIKGIKRDAVIALFENYVKYLVYRNLCNADDGFFDKCRKKLNEAISSLDFDNIKLSDGTRISEMGQQYKKYLIKLNNDTKRWVYPSLDTLYNFSTATFVAGNSVEQKYSTIVAQKDDGSPVLGTKTIDVYQNQDNLLFDYKRQCVDELNRRDVQWKSWFEMKDDDTPETFGRKIKTAFDGFVTAAVSKAGRLSKDDSLAIKFNELGLDNQTQTELINRIKSFSEISLAVKYQRNMNTCTSLVVGDFTNNPWLQAGLAPSDGGLAGANNMSLTLVPSTVMPDRIVSLFVRFGYALNEYRYYSEYEDFFKYIQEHPAERVNPTYNDKRFWSANGNIGEYFSTIKRTKDKNAALKVWKDKYGVLIKFVSLFLYKILKSCRDNAIIRKVSSDDFFKLETAVTKSSKKSKTSKTSSVPKIKAIYFGKTEDDKLYNADELPSYKADSDTLKVDFKNEYKSVTELRPSVPYFEFWLRLLSKTISQSEGTDNTLDRDSINDAFDKAISEIGNYDSDSRTFIETNIVNKYRSIDPQTLAVSIDWLRLLSDYIILFQK